MINLSQIRSILSDQDPATTERLARDAQRVTEQFFGRTISLYGPLYLSNHCSSQCTYCGFSGRNAIQRYKLTPAEMRTEMEYIAATGLENILLLTGESYTATPLAYLLTAVEIAKEHFATICLETHPLETDEYRQLFDAGVDGLTVYQETYDRERYAEVHLAGKKRDYDHRYATPQRAAEAGMRQISLGILLGLGPLDQDLLALYQHLREMERRFPGVEYSLSFPRLRAIKGQDPACAPVDDATFLKILCLSRVLLPRVGINLSTREAPRLRDHALGLGVTRISAGSKTSVGGYSLSTAAAQDPQFDIEDPRGVSEIVTMLKSHGFDPVLTDWRRIGAVRS